MAKKIKKSELEALRKSIASGKSRNTMSKAQLDSYRKKNSENWTPIELYKKDYDLQTADGKNFGSVSYDAIKAIESGTLDSYQPKDDNEKKTISNYMSNASVPFAIEIDGEVKNFGKVSPNALKAVTDGTIENYTPVNDSEKQAIDEYKRFAEEYAKKQREPENLPQGLLHGLGYTLEKFGSGAADLIGDTGDFINGGIATIARHFTWGSWNEYLKNEAEYLLDRDTFGDKWSESAESRYRVPDGYRETGGNVAQGVGNLAIPIAIDALTLGIAPTEGYYIPQMAKIASTASKATSSSKALSLASNLATKLVKPKASEILFGLGAAGSGAKEGYKISGDVGKALNYGILNGLGEMATEKLFGGFAGLGDVDELIDVYKYVSKIPKIGKLASTKYGKKVLDIAFEGVEESIMALANPAMQKLTVNPDAKFSDLGLGESFFQGVLLSSVMNGAKYTLGKAIDITNKMKAIKDVNASIKEINATLPSDVKKLDSLKLTAKVDEINRRYADVERVKAIKDINNSIDGVNAIMNNDASKITPLNYNSTIDEIKQKQNELSVFGTGYADLMVEELTKNNPEYFANIESEITEQTSPTATEQRNIFTGELDEIASTEMPSVSVGDAFIDTKTNNILKVVGRDDTSTTIEITTPSGKKETITRPNSKADTLAVDDMYSKIENTSDNAVANATPNTNASVETEISATVDRNVDGIGDIYNIYGADAELITEKLGLKSTPVEVDGKTVPHIGLSPDAFNIVSQELNKIGITLKSESPTTTAETENKPESDKMSSSNKVDISDVEVSVVVDAMEETLLPGAKEAIFKAMANQSEKGDITVFAKELREYYANNGTIGANADYFSDGGREVVFAIERTMDTTSLNTKSEAETNVAKKEENSTKVLKNESNSDTIESKTEQASIESVAETSKAETSETIDIEEERNKIREKAARTGEINLDEFGTLMGIPVTHMSGTKAKETSEQKNKPKVIRAKKSDWASHDVLWYAPNSKTIVAYSTRACKDLIDVMADDNPTMTISELHDAINYDDEAKKVLQAYIDSGFGDDVANEHFSYDGKTTDEGKTTETVADETSQYDVTLTDKCTLTATKRTDNGKDIWVISLNDRISADEFSELRKIVKQHGGNYSRFAKAPDGKSIPGFIFNSEPTADVINAFNDFFGYTEETASDADAQTAYEESKNQPESDAIEVKEPVNEEGVKNDESQSEVLARESGNDDRGLHSGVAEPAEQETTERVDGQHRENSGEALQQSVGTDGDRRDVRDDSERVHRGNDSDISESDTTGESTEIADSTPETIETEDKSIENKRPSNKENFVITDDIAREFDNTPPSAEDNIKAIELLLALESEGRTATAEEKKVLAKYKGWGGINIRRLPWELHSKVLGFFEGQQLRDMQNSETNAFFTPTKVIDAMYNGLKRMGFKGGNVLESSMGVGNFFGRMPVAMVAKSALTGVELESYTARIAQYLYPGATVINKPFQDVAIRNGSYDLVIGNVPFGTNKISYNKKKYSLHNYFIISSLDKVKDGGVVAVITSAGTLDSYGLDARKAIMDRADVVACYKLPAGVFSRNASTDVQTDLLILRKRASDAKPSGDSILNVTTTEDGLRLNEYFVKNPENVLGTLAKGTNAWGEITTVLDSGDFYERLNEAMKKLPQGLISGKVELKPIETIVSTSSKPRFFEKNGKIYADDGAGTATEVTNRVDTVRAYMAVRDAYKDLLDAYAKDMSDEDIKPFRDKLTKAYDHFYKKHTAITGDGKKKIGTSKSKDNRFLKNDADYYLVSGLEKYNKDEKKIEKSELFEKDTLRKKKVTSVDSASEALAVSLNESGKIDFSRMQDLTGKTEKQLIDELNGEIVLTPDGDYVLTDIYLSGNIYEKIEAVKNKPEFKKQKEMLEKVLPTPKDASSIMVKLGANYIEPKYIEAFSRDIFNERISVSKNSSGAWSIEGVRQSRWGDILNVKYGCAKFNAIQLLEKVLNDSDITANKKVKIDGKSVDVFDEEMTQVARQKAEDIKEAFENWIFRDSERRTDIVDKYNRTYNNYRSLDYERIAEKLSFDSMNETLKTKLYPHQKKGIARFLFGGNILFAHGVGTGKTFEMIASVMEAKRMGIINKTAMVVPNNKVTDFRNDIAEAYPDAKVLVVDSADKKRQTMLGLVNSNDWDIILIPRTTFTKIPVGSELQQNFINQQIEDFDRQIAEAEYDRNISKRAVDGLKKRRENLTQKLKDLDSDTKRDENSVDFEKLGFDCICVDEAHNYKSITTPTKLNIKGLASGSDAQQANDMLMKLDYMRSMNGRIIFGTGTPITNTVAEIYNMMRMVRPEILEDAGIHSLDEWVNTFANIETITEIGIDNKVKNKSTQIIRKFVNVNEMVGMFRQFADVIFTQDVVKNLPKAKHIPIEIEGTEEHRQIEKTIADTIANATGNEALKAYTKAMALANAAAVDLKLLSGADSDVNIFKDYSVEELEFENSKINTMCNIAYDEYKASNKIKGTQIIFCDGGAGSGKTYSFNVHNDIKQKLIERGVPENEIVIVKNQNNTQLEELFVKVNSGEVRFLIGTSRKMAEGLNVQKRVVAIHHPTVTYKPSDLEQGDARGVRAGNINEEVKIYRYLQGNTFDSYKWQAIDRKGAMINAALRGENVDELEDIGADDDSDAGVDAATAMAITSGNPLVKEKIDIDKEVKRLKTLKQNYMNEYYRYQDAVAKNPNQIRQLTEYAQRIEKDIALRDKYSDNDVISIKGKSFEKRADANKALIEAVKAAPKNGQFTKIGEYNGFDIMFKGDTGGMGYSVILKGSNEYSVEYAGNGNNIARIDGVLKRLDAELKRVQSKVKTLESDLEFAKQEIDKPFEKEKDLTEALEKQKDITYRYEHFGETQNTEQTATDETEQISYSIEREGEYEREGDLLHNDSQQWYVREYSGEQVAGLAKATESGSETAKARKAYTAKLNPNQLDEKVVTDKHGNKHKYVEIKSSAWNNQMNKISDYYAQKDVNVHFIKGGVQIAFVGEDKTANAMRIENDIYISYDNAWYTPEQLSMHEYIHIKYETPEFQKTVQDIVEALPKHEYKKLVDKVKKAYGDIIDNPYAYEEELICDVLSGMTRSSFLRNGEIVLKFWARESADMFGHDASQYADSIDAGGVNSNIIDSIGFGDGFILLENLDNIPYNEHRQLEDFITDENYSNKLKTFSCTEIGNNFYIWKNLDENNYKIKFVIPIIGNDDVIEFMRSELNGTNRKNEGISNLYKSFYGRYGNSDRSGFANQNRQSTNGNDRVLNATYSERQTNIDRRGNIGESHRDTSVDKINYSFSSADNDIEALTPERKKEIFEQFERNRVGVDKPTQKQLWGERAEWIAHNVTRVFPDIPERGEKGTFFAEFRKMMIQWKALPQTSMFMTQDKLNQMTKDLTPNEFKTFSELVYFLDLQEEAQMQKERGYDEILLPNEITPYEVDQIVDVLNNEATANVKQALDKRRQIWDDLKEQYITLNQYIGFDTDGKFERKNYYHHQVIDYMSKGGKGVAKGKEIEIKAGRGWLKERQGSTKAINTDFLAVEHKAMLQMQYDIYVANMLGKIKDKYDIKPQLEKQAFNNNKNLLNEIIKKEATDEDGNVMLDDKGRPDSETYRQQQWYNQRIMFGFSGLFDLAKEGMLPIFNGQYGNVIRALGRNNLNVPGLYDYVGKIASMELSETATDEETQAQISARTVLKYTSQKKAWVKETLADDYQTWKSLAADMKDSHSIHQPRRGNYFYTKTTIDEDAFNKAFNDMIVGLVAGENGIDTTADTKKLFEQYSETVRLMGAAYEQWVIPNEIETTMNKVANPKQASVVSQLSRAILSAWKGWATSVNPLRTVTFGLRNILGDIDAVISGNPKLVTYSKQAVEEIYQAMKHKKYSPVFMEWVERGGYSSLIFANEMDTEMQDKIFSHLKDKEGLNVFKIPAKLWEGYYNGVESAHNFREAILRYSAYLYFKNDIVKNGGKVKDNVASNRYIVQGLQSVEDKAYQLSKDLLGAYDEVATMGQALRRHAIPFYSFTETNLKRYYRLFENIIMSDDTIPKKAGKVLLKSLMVNMLTLLMVAWNKLVMKDEDDELPPSVRNIPHITLGKIGDDVYAFRQLGSFAELLEWVGFEDYKWTKEDLIAPIDKVVGMITPVVKTPVELLTGLNFYPSITQPRAIRDKVEHLFSTLGVDDVYRLIAGKPTKGFGDILKGAVTYSYDYKESAYYEILDIKREYQGDTDNTIYGQTPKSNALYYMKTAIRYKDKKAALKYLNEYFENGGTAKGISQSIEMLNPMYGYTGKDTIAKGEEFVNSLNDDEKDKLKIAISYYENDLMLPENVSAMLRKKGITDEQAKNLLTNYINSKCK